MTTKITYSELYSDMVKCFSVNKDDIEYKLGDYMRMKASKNKSQEAAAPAGTSNLPVAAGKYTAGTAITAFFTYVNDKLTVKQAPVRDKTIRRFPLRTSLTALCSALLISTLIFCYGLIGLRSEKIDAQLKSDISAEYESSETYLSSENGNSSLC